MNNIEFSTLTNDYAPLVERAIANFILRAFPTIHHQRCVYYVYDYLKMNDKELNIGQRYFHLIDK